MKACPRRWTAAFALALVAPLLLAGGCREDVTLGSDPALVTCPANACGARCTFDACPASTPGCGLPPAAGFCDWSGACAAAMPACAPDPQCQGHACGMACQPSMTSPPGPYTCSQHERCEPGLAMCPAPDPCHGHHCGEMCTPQCQPMADGGCPPPPLPMACDMGGHCSPAAMVGCMGMAPYFPCMGKKCNDPCTLCDPMDPGCMEAPMPKACDATGTCTPAMVTCP